MKYIKLENEVIFPSKVICIGRNYVDHIDELNNEIPNEPVIFIKPNSSISNEIYFNAEESIDYEGELAFLTRKGEIIGVGIGLDLTKRAIQSRLKQKGLPWERAKSFDDSAVLSEFVKFDGDLSLLSMELVLNGKLVQSGDYSLMLNKPGDIVHDIKGFLTLEDGDLIMSGTPKGVGEFKLGDIFEGKVYEGGKLILQASWAVKLKHNNGD